jgi:uncharacterized membrane protein
MIPLSVLGGSFVILLVLGRAGVPGLEGWLTSLRLALAVMFFVTASAHWGDKRGDLIAMVPPGIPLPELVVTLTGLAEIAGAIGLVIPRLAPYAATGLALLLVAMLPANVYAAIAQLSIDGRPVLTLVPRVCLQLVFLGAVLVAGFCTGCHER